MMMPPLQPLGAYKPEGPRSSSGHRQQHMGKRSQACLTCGGDVEMYAKELGSCQKCGADYFMRRVNGKWILKLIKAGRPQ